MYYTGEEEENCICLNLCLKKWKIQNGEYTYIVWHSSSPFVYQQAYRPSLSILLRFLYAGQHIFVNKPYKMTEACYDVHVHNTTCQ